MTSQSFIVKPTGFYQLVLAKKWVKPTNGSPWIRGKLVGQKSPLRLRDIWGIRIRLELAARVRDLALFDLAIDSKLRACDPTKLRVRDVADGAHVSSRTIVMQQNTHQPLEFEITAQTRTALDAWLNHVRLKNENYLFPNRQSTSPHLYTRQYARIVKSWVASIALDPVSYPIKQMEMGFCRSLSQYQYYLKFRLNKGIVMALDKPIIKFKDNK